MSRHSFKKFSISLQKQIFEKLEQARGLIPRSRFIADILQESLDKPLPPRATAEERRKYIQKLRNQITQSNYEASLEDVRQSSETAESSETVRKKRRVVSE